MTGTLRPKVGIIALVAAGAILVACTTEKAPDPPTRDGAAAPTSVCQRSAQGEAGDLALARCLATQELVPEKAAAQSPVAVYFDRSGSMRGFLDPSYPTRIRTDYRSVIDRLVVGLTPTRGFSFGSELRPIEPTLATLGARDFYSDKDTRTEQALAEIARDSTRASSHIIVGDGRRGSPTAGDAQYVRMREVADRWIDGGGSFVIATSLAPFKTVPTDPSGCRASSVPTTGDLQTCPLYAFGFIAPGEGARIVSTLASVFQHVFIWPSPTIPASELAVTPVDPSRRDVRVERRWATAAKGTPIVRVRGDSATNKTLTATIGIRDTTTAEGLGYAAILASQEVNIQTYSRGFNPAAATQEWMPVEARGALVRPGTRGADGALTLDFVTRGARGPVSMFRIDLVPAGSPNWLEQFDAENASDVVRTYGLGRLFESFKTRAKVGNLAPFGRFFIVAS